MNKKQQTIELLSKFNHRTFKRDQWDIILNGCGCPKTGQFWMALRNICMSKEICFGNTSTYKLEATKEDFENVWKEYSDLSSKYTKTYNNKKEAKQKAMESVKRMSKIQMYIVNGCVTTEKPENERYQFIINGYLYWFN